MNEAEKAYQFFVIAVPENEEQAKAYFWARKALQSTLTPPNEWVSVYDRLPEPGERVLATDCGFVGEFYINKRGKWQRYNVNCSRGAGYCCQVVLSKSFDTMECATDCRHRAPRIRRPQDERCELYEPGNFAARYR